MPKDDLSHTDRPISSSDLLTLLLQKKWLIIGVSVLGAVLLGLWAMTRPLLFHAESTFQEKSVQGSAGTGMSGFLGLLSGNLSGRTDTAIPLMKSKRLLAPLAQEYGLQVVINEEVPSWPLLETVRANLYAEWAYLKGLRGPLYADRLQPLVVRDASYIAEIPTQITLHFRDNDTFDIFNPKNQELIGQGALGSPIQGADYYVVFEATTNDQPLTDRKFSITFETLEATTKNLSDHLIVKADEKSDKILKLTFASPNRRMSSQLLNSLMDEYQKHLKVEHRNLADAQLAYLEGRRKDSAENLHHLIADYAETVSEGLASSGIMESEKELQRLEHEKSECRQRLMVIELELYRLQNNSNEGGYLTTLGATQDLPELIQETIGNLNDLKQRRDRLALALRKSTNISDEQLQEQLKEQIADITALQTEMEQAARLQVALAENGPLPTPQSLSTNSSPLMKVWYSKIYDLDSLRRQAPSTSSESEWTDQRGHFLNYLDNFNRLSKVHQRLMRERLALQQNPGQELQGVDLVTAGNLYIALTTQKNDVQADIRQNTFVIDQVQDPTFEVSALSGIIKDPVGQGIVQHYSSQSMSLQDSNIRTAKELARIKEELAQDRSFLLFHLQQGTELMRLREDFLEKKIRTIQEVMLDLTQQQVSIGEKHLDDYTQAHIEQLKEEKAFLTRLVHDINQQMAYLPQKWVAEQVIKHQAAINSAIVEEVSKLVETKNISQHLEMVQSGPLDHASAPTLPKRPQILLFAIIGLFLGAGFGTLWVICKGLWDGIVVSEANLSLEGQYVAGQLPLANCQKNFKPMENDDQLATLRRIATHLCQKDNTSDNSLLLLLGKGVDYSHDLALLLSKKGHKVLVLDLSFNNHETNKEQLPGLLQVLEGTANKPKIISSASYDIITSGGASTHGLELLQSLRFDKLFDELSEQYDWIIAAKRSEPASAEAEALSNNFSHIAITVTAEALNDLNYYLELVQDNKTRIAYLFTTNPN